MVNKTDLGSRIRGILRSPEVFRLIYNKGVGWLDGGCVTLSSAFAMWMKEAAEIWCVYEGQLHHHVVTKIRGEDLYLDGDGLGNRNDLLIKMAEAEGLRGSLSLYPFDLTELPIDFSLWPDVALAVAEILHQRLGPWECAKKVLLPPIPAPKGLTRWAEEVHANLSSAPPHILPQL